MTWDGWAGQDHTVTYDLHCKENPVALWRAVWMAGEEEGIGCLGEH